VTRGASIEARDGDGATALEIATAKRWRACVTVLSDPKVGGP
jgi:hypothetical protein